MVWHEPEAPRSLPHRRIGVQAESLSYRQLVVTREVSKKVTEGHNPPSGLYAGPM